MGQQQLILLVLGVVIVGLSVVVGIQMFSAQKTKSDLDLTQVEAVRLATSASVWRETPTIKGGGLNTGSFAGFRLGVLGYEGAPFDVGTGNEAVVAGGHIYSVWNRDSGTAHVAVINIEYTVQGAVFLYGPTPDCLVMRTGVLNTGTNTWNYQPSETPPKPAGCGW